LRVSCTDSDVKVVIKKIKAGKIIVFPTDTVYGIGCDPYNKKAVLRLYEIKKREKTKPFPVLGLSKMELEKILENTNNKDVVKEKEDDTTDDDSEAETKEVDFKSMKVTELKELLKEKDLPVSGTKAELIERLQT